MNKLVLVALAALVLAGAKLVPGTAGSNSISTGINGESLSAAPVTDVIPHPAGRPVYLQALVTKGTSATLTVSCEESSDGAGWSWMAFCTQANPGVCGRHKLQFSLATETSFTVAVTSSMGYLRCTFDDEADGTGTVIVQGEFL